MDIDLYAWIRGGQNADWLSAAEADALESEGAQVRVVIRSVLGDRVLLEQVISRGGKETKHEATAPLGYVQPIFDMDDALNRGKGPFSSDILSPKS
jgi:hypothetical protein